jgi:hypothetical protein
MPIINGVFFEQQRGGLCRLHSINGYFGCVKFTPEQFTKYQHAYDIEYKKKFNFETSCKNFDIVTSDQKNIISYILNDHKIYTRYYAVNQLYRKNIKENIIDILKGDWFFVYNESHIFGARRHNKTWYKVDSLNGVGVIDVNSFSNTKNIGFIVPIDIQKEFFHNLVIIKNVLNECLTIEKIKTFLIQKNKERKILGCLEIPLGICMDILETNLLNKKLPKNKMNEFNVIQTRIISYNKFIQQFTNGNYNDINLILAFLPEILFDLVSLNTP